MWFRNLPIRRKLVTMMLLTSGVVLGVTCAAFLGYEFLTFRRTAIQQLSILSEVIAANSTGAVAFDNAKDAAEILAGLKAERQIEAACIYDHDGRLFARYPAGALDHRFPARPHGQGFEFVGGHLAAYTPIIQAKGSERFGTLYVESNLDAMRQRLKLYGLIALVAIVVSGAVAYTLSVILQRQISRPMLALADAAQIVSARRDYSIRAEKLSADELGLLTDTFNHMLAQIEEQNAGLERRVQERTAELEAANDELEAFTLSAAHDLRTPIRAITGFSELLLLQYEAELPPAAVRYIRLINSGSEQMSALITGLLSFSRLGRQALNRTHLDFEALWHEVYQDLESERTGRNVRFTVHALPAVEADRALLRVVAMNLLANALKYSRPRSTAVIEVGEESAAGAEVRFYVRDNGVGFAMQDAGKLFGVFQRLHHAHEFEGTGIGLATVRRIIERHGGTIWAEAEPGRGATFYFTLPG